MHAYGHSRRDKYNCWCGCCATKSLKVKRCRVRVDRQNRKSARQSAMAEINYGLDEINQEIIDLFEEYSDFDYDERYDFYEFKHYTDEDEEDDFEDDWLYDTYDFDDYFLDESFY